MKESLLAAWQIHNNKNILLLNNSEEPALNLRLSTKGRTIGEQLVHMHNNRITWTEFVAKSIFDKSLLIDKTSAPTRFLLIDAFISSAQKIDEVINISWEKGGRLPSFKNGLMAFIAYLISHESHHRGNILLTLKQSSVKLSNELKWGLWDWQK